ncbi:MAG: pyridoxal phosphate-dependent aminotransferase [Bacteroidetes bacterium]|nr:pyridoxal phosphate-dependent aminotransferase [Bacteroidota bacterium]
MREMRGMRGINCTTPLSLRFGGAGRKSRDLFAGTHLALSMKICTVSDYNVARDQGRYRNDHPGVCQKEIHASRRNRVIRRSGFPRGSTGVDANRFQNTLLVYHGDLIIPAPSWVSYAPQAKILGRNIHWIKTRYEDNWLIQADELERICFKDPDRARLMIINYPSNPTGRTYSIEQLKDLATVARKHGVVLLSDEIYGKLHHDGTHKSIVEFYPEGTIFSGGLSKWCGAGGWRLGLFVFPENLRWLLKGMATVASETFTSTSSPIQHAAIAAFQYNDIIETYLIGQRKILKALGKMLTEKLQHAGVKVRCPEGAFYIFPDFSDFSEKFRHNRISDSKGMCGCSSSESLQRHRR